MRIRIIMYQRSFDLVSFLFGRSANPLFARLGNYYVTDNNEFFYRRQYLRYGHLGFWNPCSDWFDARFSKYPEWGRGGSILSLRRNAKYIVGNCNSKRIVLWTSNPSIISLVYSSDQQTNPVYSPLFRDVYVSIKQLKTFVSLKFCMYIYIYIVYKYIVMPEKHLMKFVKNGTSGE